MDSVPKSPNGNRPAPLEQAAPDAGLIPRLMSWVDVAVAHLISDRRRRAVIQRSRKLDDRLERAARRLTPRQRGRSTE
ncbi:MAG TPA: hypothetical protein VEF89_29585 [Solirubrobacteraceae bacterium]|nr:hypothetical protein [Solirubrobacteraceae bacterium]